MRLAPGLGHSGEIPHKGEGFHVQNFHSTRSGHPQSSETVLVTVADNVSHETGNFFLRELYERIAVISHQSPAESTYPSITLAVEIDSVDILVRKSSFP